MASSETRIKGQAFRGLLSALEVLRGAESVRAVLADMPGEAGEALRSGKVIASGWYPSPWYAELHAAIHRTLRVGPEFSRTLSMAATKADINSVYRFVMRLLSPTTLLAQMPRVWSLYVQGPDIEMTDRRENAVRFKVVGMHGYNRGCWEDLVGGAMALLEVIGARDVRARVVSGGRDGDDDAEIDVFWQK